MQRGHIIIIVSSIIISHRTNKSITAPQLELTRRQQIKLNSFNMQNPQQQQQPVAADANANDNAENNIVMPVTPPKIEKEHRTIKSNSNESLFLSTLKSQIEFYFSPQNLARDSYLRSIMAQYGGAMVPLHVISSFPKVREICAMKTGSPAIPAEPFVIMKAMEGSNVAKITQDGIWIGPLALLPPLDPAAIKRLGMQSRPQPLVRQVSAGSATVMARQVSLGNSAGSAPIMRRQVSVGNSAGSAPAMRRQMSSGSFLSLGRDASPVSAHDAVSGDTRSTTTTTTSHATLIVSDCSTEIAAEIVISAFTSDKVAPKSAKPSSDANAWLVFFESEKHARIALSTAAGNTINGLPVRAKMMRSGNVSPMPEEGSGESDNVKSQQQQQQQQLGVPQIPPLQQHIQYPPHIVPPQGMPNNAGAPAYNYYPYPLQYQYPAGRYPPQPSSMQYHHPQMYGPSYPQHSMQSVAHSFYPGPNQVPRMRSITDPGQKRQNNIMKGAGKNDNGNNYQQQNNRRNSKIRKGIPQQPHQQGYPDNYGGANQIMTGQRVSRVQREGYDNGGDVQVRKNLVKNRDGIAQGGQSKAKSSSSPMLDAVDSFEWKNRNKKNKPKRRNTAEIFDENMFPALSSVKSQQPLSNGLVSNAPSNGFSGYADALLQKNKAKASETDFKNVKKAESKPQSIDEILASIKVSDEAEDSIKKVEEADESGRTLKPSSKESSDSQIKSAADAAVSDGTTSTSSIDTTSPVPQNEPTSKEVTDIHNKLGNEKQNGLHNKEKDDATVTETRRNDKKTPVEASGGVEIKPLGAWGSKRSFIDVSI